LSAIRDIEGRKIACPVPVSNHRLNRLSITSSCAISYFKNQILMEKMIGEMRNKMIGTLSFNTPTETLLMENRTKITKALIVQNFWWKTG
jgi:hypothetical protein